MDKIKVELLKLSNERGDHGSVEDRRQFIQVFMDALHLYLTPEAIRSFELFHLRALMVHWFRAAAETDVETANRDLVLYIDVAPEPRQRPAEEPVAENIVNMFAKSR